MSEEPEVAATAIPRGDVSMETGATSTSTENQTPITITEDTELAKMKADMEKMEEESRKLKELQSQLEKNSQFLMSEEKSDIDSRSVYVGGVDYGATPEELQQHFQAAGVSPINRVTILLDKQSGHPKGFAYVEFSNEALVNEAIKLNDTEFRGRQLKVSKKRTNVPGLSRGRGRGRGRGGFRGRGAFRARGGYRGGFRGRGGFNPY